MIKLGDLNICIISMKKNKERRDKIELTPNYYINAFDGKALGKNFLDNQLISYTGKCWYNAFNSPVKEKTLGKMGCFLSHFKCLKILPRPTIILEDDFKCDYGDLREIDIDLPEDNWDILFLSGFSNPKGNHIEEPLENHWNYIDSDKMKWWTTSAYIVREPKKLLEILKSHRPCTLDSYYNKHVFNKLDCYYHYPPIVYQNEEFDSTIDNENKYKKKSFFMG